MAFSVRFRVKSSCPRQSVAPCFFADRCGLRRRTVSLSSSPSLALTNEIMMMMVRMMMMVMMLRIILMMVRRRRL